MNAFFKYGTLVSAAFALAACDLSNDDDNDKLDATFAQIQVVHASPDAPKVDVYANDAKIFENADYGAITSTKTVFSGMVKAKVVAKAAAGDVTVFGPVDLTLNKDTRYTLVASGDTADLHIDTVTRPAASIASGKTQVTVFHGASHAPAVDVYVTAPDASLATAAALGNFSYRQTLGPVTVDNASYRIRVTPTGNRETVVFDSGTVTLNGGDLLLVASENLLQLSVAPSASPIYLALSDGQNPSSIIWDAQTPASLRVVHASADAPAVDVAVNDQFSPPAVNALAFADFTGYLNVPPATYNVKVAADANNDVVVIDADLTLAKGSVSSVLAVGALASIEPLVLSDDIRRVATDTKIRVVHGSPTAGAVDIYVLSGSQTVATATPAFTNVPFKANTGYVSLPPGNYALAVTPTGSKTVAIGPLDVTLAAKTIHTVIARDNEGGGTPLNVILMDDFVAL